MRVMVKSTHKVELGGRETYYGIPMTMREGGWLVSDELDAEKTGVEALLDAGSVIEFDEKLLRSGAGSARAQARGAAMAASAAASARAGASEESPASGEESQGRRKRE